MLTEQQGETSKATGVILAGGRSRRLGVDKTTLRWPVPDLEQELEQGQRVEMTRGTTLLEAIAAKLARVCDEVLIVAYRGAQPLSYRVVPDVYRRGGSLGGVYAGLAAAAHDRILVVATDMPFLSTHLLRWMLTQPRDYDALVPLDDQPQPLHAIYTKRCLEPMRRRLDAGQLRLSGLFEDVRTRFIDATTLAAHDPSGRSFFNINTPHDLEQAKRLLHADRGGAVWLRVAGHTPEPTPDLA